MVINNNYGATLTTTMDALPFLTAYNMQSTTNFLIKIEANVTSASTYETTIRTDSDCTISRVKFYVLLIDR